MFTRAIFFFWLLLSNCLSMSEENLVASFDCMIIVVSIKIERATWGQPSGSFDLMLNTILTKSQPGRRHDSHRRSNKPIFSIYRRS